MGPLQSIDGVVDEIMRIHRSLPPRPGIDEVDAARALVRNVEKEEQARLDAISKQKKGFEIPEELFFVLQEMQKNLVCFQSKEQKREAQKLLDLENTHVLFDDLIQRASRSLPSSSNGLAPSISANSARGTAASSKTSFDTNTTASAMVHSEQRVGRSFEGVSRDDSYLKKEKSTMYADGFGGVDPHVLQRLLQNPATRPEATFGESGSLSSYECPYSVIPLH